MICPNCNNQVPDGIKFCPNCGKNLAENTQPNQQNYTANGQPIYNTQPPVKEPIGSKTWFVVLMFFVFWPVGLFCMWKYEKANMAVRVIVSVLAAFWGLMWFSVMITDTEPVSTPPSYSDTVTTPETPAEPATEASATPVTPAEPVTEAPAVPAEPETPAPADNGETPYFIFDAISASIPEGDNAFAVGTKETAFLQAHPQLFPAASAADCSAFVDSSISYKHIAKSEANYGDKLMSVTGYVIGVSETAPEITGLSKPLTELQIVDDDGNCYTIYYIGSVDIFEDDTVTVIGLPLDMTSFSNVSGGTTIAPVIAGSYITKIQ